jgi:polyhydroxyalkanoate synthase
MTDNKQNGATGGEVLQEESRKGIAADKTAWPGDRAEMGARTAEDAGAADGALGLNPFMGVNDGDILGSYGLLAQQALREPTVFLEQYAKFWYEMALIVTGRSGLEPDRKDKRFGEATWRDNALYHAWMQVYLAWRKGLGALVEGSGLSGEDAERARFAVSLLTEAASPTNTLLGNPQAMKKFFETGGMSLARGLTNLIGDVAHNGGMPSQVDKSAFEVGDNLAVSEGAVVFRNEVLELIQYAPKTEQVHERPLVLVPPQVNKFYVYDLSPEKSFVRYAVENGVQFFAVSWRNPTPEMRDWGFETYVAALLEAIDAVREITGSESVNMMGACSGGMTLVTLLGHLAATGDRRVNSATLMVAVLDTSAESQLGMFATPGTIQTAKQVSGRTGVLEGQEMARVFAWMRPNDLVWNYWVNNYLLGNAPPAFDVLYWNNDTTRLPARLHHELLDLFARNSFKHPGMLEVLGTPIDLSEVDLDTFILAGMTDHITPWRGNYATTQMLGGESEFVLSSSGHIQSILNPPGNPKAKFYTGAQCPTNPDEWLAEAQQHPGSWWDHWRAWISERSGASKDAPEALGNERHPPGTRAPGTYVFES